MCFGKLLKRFHMLIRHSRDSADEQPLGLQLDALKKAGGKQVFTARASAVRGSRSGLVDAVSHLRRVSATSL
jgi:hypothetical protein